MSFLFGGAPPKPGDPAREHQRNIRHALRSLEREDIKAGAQETTLAMSIHKHAKDGRLALCKVKAKELIRLRAHRSRMVTMKGHLSTLEQQLATVKTGQLMQETMAKTTKLLQGMNRRMDVQSVHRMLLEFEKQSVSFNDKQQIVEETLDDVFEEDNEKADTEDAVADVFKELGLDAAFLLSATSSTAAAPSVEDLEARLSRMRA